MKLWKLNGWNLATTFSKDTCHGSLPSIRPTFDHPDFGRIVRKYGPARFSYHRRKLSSQLRPTRYCNNAHTNRTEKQLIALFGRYLNRDTRRLHRPGAKPNVGGAGSGPPKRIFRIQQSISFRKAFHVPVHWRFSPINNGCSFETLIFGYVQ
jgi:hypothetical protein